MTSSDNNNLPAAIELNDVTKIYRLFANRTDQVIDSLGLASLPFLRVRSEPTDFHALRGISFSIGRGERVGIVGRNGAGKTTLLKLITGNFAPTTGHIKVNGRVQALMQTGLGFHPDFTGYENIVAALQYNGLSAVEHQAAVDDVVDFVELGEFLRQPVQTYSQGMLARLQFATSTAVKPEILIIDEVLGAGDAYFIGKSAHRMEKLANSGCTLLLVSHSTQQVLQFCDKAIWIDRGEVRQQGAALEVVRAYEEYIQTLAQESKSPPDSVKSVSADSGDYDTPKWQQERMLTMLSSGPGSHAVKSANADEISRWPGEAGLNIVRVEVIDGNGQVAVEVTSGETLTIEIELEAEFDGVFECRMVVLLMTLEGVPVCRHLSEYFEIDLAAHARRVVRLCYEHTILAAGEFIFSAAAYKHFDPEKPTKARRYDLLSRSFRLKVLSAKGHEPGLFHHPARWELDHDLPTLDAKKPRENEVTDAAN